MAIIVIDEKEIIAVIMKPVGSNGQISIGSEFAGMPIVAYITMDRRDYVVNDQNSKKSKIIK